MAALRRATNAAGAGAAVRSDAYACLQRRAPQRPTTIASSAFTGRAPVGFGTTRRRTETTAREASWSVSPWPYVLTRWLSLLAVFIPSQWCLVPGLPRRLRDRNGITRDSATAALGFRTRDRDRTGSVAVEALRRFIHRLRPKRAAHVLRGAVPGARGERAQAVVPVPSTRSPRASGVHRGRSSPAASGTSSDQPRGCDDSVTSRVRYPSRMCPPVASGESSDEPRGCDDSFTGRHRDVLRLIRAASSASNGPL